MNCAASFSIEAPAEHKAAAVLAAPVAPAPPASAQVNMHGVFAAFRDTWQAMFTMTRQARPHLQLTLSKLLRQSLLARLPCEGIIYLVQSLACWQAATGLQNQERYDPFNGALCFLSFQVDCACRPYDWGQVFQVLSRVSWIWCALVSISASAEVMTCNGCGSSRNSVLVASSCMPAWLSISMTHMDTHS